MEVEPMDGRRMGPESGFFYWSATRRKFKLRDPFFAAGDIERELLAKHVALDLSEDENSAVQHLENADQQKIFCPIVGCGTQLRSLEDFEDHYRGRHTASCSVCSRVYPTSRLLSIHVSEAHDSYFQAKAARGFPMYECLVDGCGIKLKSYESRNQHLIDKHKFPVSFEFYKKAHPSKHQRQKHQGKQAGQEEGEKGMKHERQKHQGKQASQEEDEKGMKHQRQKHQGKQAGEEEDENGMKMDVERKCIKQKFQPKQSVPMGERVEITDMEVEKVNELTSSLSRLSTSDSTPTSINFGHRHNKGFAFVPRSVQRNKSSRSSDNPS